MCGPRRPGKERILLRDGGASGVERVRTQRVAGEDPNCRRKVSEKPETFGVQCGYLSDCYALATHATMGEFGGGVSSC